MEKEQHGSRTLKEIYSACTRAEKIIILHNKDYKSISWSAWMVEAEGYVRCHYSKGIFSTQRIVEFRALGVYRYPESFDEERNIGSVLSDIRWGHMFDRVGEGYGEIAPGESEGEGLVKCFLVNHNNTQALVGVIDAWLHDRVVFRIPREDFIRMEEVKIESWG